jgi:threonine/homoserine/homoserine lactone efflux protein
LIKLKQGEVSDTSWLHFTLGFVVGLLVPPPIALWLLFRSSQQTHRRSAVGGIGISQVLVGTALFIVSIVGLSSSEREGLQVILFSIGIVGGFLLVIIGAWMVWNMQLPQQEKRKDPDTFFLEMVTTTSSSYSVA